MALLAGGGGNKLFPGRGDRPSTADAASADRVARGGRSGRGDFGSREVSSTGRSLLAAAASVFLRIASLRAAARARRSFSSRTICSLRSRPMASRRSRFASSTQEVATKRVRHSRCRSVKRASAAARSCAIRSRSLRRSAADGTCAATSPAPMNSDSTENTRTRTGFMSARCRRPASQGPGTRATPSRATERPCAEIRGRAGLRYTTPRQGRRRTRSA